MNATLDRPSTAGRVDRQRNVIYDVKVLGNRSTHNRLYPFHTQEAAVREGLFEGKPAYWLHARPGTTRDPADQVGTLRNARVVNNSVVADFHYFPNHARAAEILEAADHPERSTTGFSINGEGDSYALDGYAVVVHITAIHSVDVVRAGATTKNFFESAGLTESAPPNLGTWGQLERRLASDRQQAAAARNTPARRIRSWGR